MSEVLPKCTNSFYCEFGFFWIFFHALQYFTLCSLYVSGTSERGTPSEQLKGSLKSHQKIKLEGKPWAPHPQRPSPPGPPPRLEPHAGGLGTLTRIPPRARLAMEGLGRGCILRIARGLSRHASARNPISVSRKASFSVSLEPGSSIARRPPPRPTLPPARHVPLIRQPLLQSQPDDGYDTTEWPTGPKVASAPYQLGQGTAGITGHCVLMLCP